MKDAARTSLVTTAAMMMAGVVSLHSPDLGLSLVDAQIITLMSLLTTFFYAWVCFGSPENVLERVLLAAHPPSRGLGGAARTQRQPRYLHEVGILGGWTISATLFVHAVLTAAFGILVYARVDTFGGAAFRPECTPNSAFIFDMFGRYISATNSGLRGFSLFVFSFVAMACLEALILYLVIVMERRERDADAFRNIEAQHTRTRLVLLKSPSSVSRLYT